MEICIFIKDKKNYKGNFKILKVLFILQNACFVWNVQKNDIYIIQRQVMQKLITLYFL